VNGPAIDVHAHALIPSALALVDGHVGALEAQRSEALTMGEASMAYNRAQVAQIMPLLTDLDARLRAMDRMRVDVQLVSPMPTHYHEWAEPSLAERITRTVNEGIAELCASRPGRLAGLGLVPLHEPGLALTELTRAMTDTGLRGVEISTTAGGRELAHPDLEPFWARAEELGALVFIHPWGCSLGHRLGEHYLGNVVGQPTETTVALSHIIFSGLLDRRPGLRILAAHGGGYLPYYIGRSDRAWEVRPDSRTARERPSSYLRRLYFDSLVFEPDALAALVARAGADRVMLGSDFPFDMGVEDPLERLEATTSLSGAEREAIRGSNAARLLALTGAGVTS
jgi:aminocarboxymuconate-semialdehyde decarboxylase